MTLHSYRNLNPHLFTYTFNGNAISRVNTFKDLGVTFQSNCLFSQHVHNIVNKAFKTLGFIKRVLHFVNDFKTILTIYIATVRSIISYASVVWCPSQVYLINEIESVQRNFIRYICNKFNHDRDAHSYEVFCQKFNLLTLHQHRLYLGLNFLYNVIHSKVQSPNLLKNISLYTPPVATRKHLVFGIKTARTEYKKRIWHQLLPQYCNDKNLIPFTNFSTWKKEVLKSL